MMEGFTVACLLLGLVLLVTIPSSKSSGLPVSCMIEYDYGGAPAVFGSPECPHWKHSASPSLQNQSLISCEFATLQGRREYQEDRVACNLDTIVSLLGKNGLEEDRIGVVAVFDGHGGNEASEMASKLLFDYFHLHVVFLSYKQMAEHKGVPPVSYYKSIQFEILKEALLKTIHDIDLKFSQEAIENKFSSGSTATVVLLYRGHTLVANVGDSKAFLVSEKIDYGLRTDGNSTKHLEATELTHDHHPDRQDERARIEAAGGSVILWGVPRVNGVLALSRSIGDVYLKRHGLIAEPEFTGWLLLAANDKYLVVASDGIFESLTQQEVNCLASEWHFDFQGSEKSQLSSSCHSACSLAECIVNTAYDRGSHDNLSVIVVPLKRVSGKL